MEGSSSVVCTCADKLCENAVCVGGADHLVNGKSHCLCDVACEDVTEVTCGNANVDLVAHSDLLFVNQVAVSGNVVNDLRSETTPVDGVCAGEEEAALKCLLSQCVVSKDSLNAVLSIVKVAVNCANVNVASFLSCHLHLLHCADAVNGEEYCNVDTVDIAVALKSCLSCVTACGNEDVSLLFLACHLESGGKETGHDLESHILKCAGRAVPELEGVYLVADVNYGSGTAGEAAVAVSLGAVSEELFFIIVCEKH